MKKKLSSNKAESRATGGGNFKKQSISTLEEAVIRLTGLETCTNGLVGTRCFGGTGVHCTNLRCMKFTAYLINQRRYTEYGDDSHCSLTPLLIYKHAGNTIE